MFEQILYELNTAPISFVGSIVGSIASIVGSIASIVGLVFTIIVLIRLKKNIKFHLDKQHKEILIERIQKITETEDEKEFPTSSVKHNIKDIVRTVSKNYVFSDKKRFKILLEEINKYIDMPQNTKNLKVIKEKLKMVLEYIRIGK